MSRAGIEQLLYMMDGAFEGDGTSGGGDWHSLLVNLQACREPDWHWLPADGRRSIIELAIHTGACKFVYGSHLAGDTAVHWDRAGTIPQLNGEPSPEVAIAYLREGQDYLRSRLVALDDDEQLLVMRTTPQYWQREARWLVKTMIEHDLYHGGEINHIRALAQRND
jgi:hypothetical protein